MHPPLSSRCLATHGGRNYNLGGNRLQLRCGTGRHFSFSLFYCIQRVSSEQSLCGALLLLSAKHGRQCARGQLAKFLLVSPVSLVKEIRPVYI